MLSRNRITIHGISTMFIGEFRATHIQFLERVVKFGETEEEFISLYGAQLMGNLKVLVA